MAHQHSPRFLKIVEDSRQRIREISIDEVRQKLDRDEKFLLVDVREDSEWAQDHLPGAVHMGRGIIERDIEEQVPNLNAPMILYCGGGFRSAMVADNLQKMGYTNVLSMDGGVRGWREKGYPFTKD
jgi:rhodanese-related sulfurtransferase